VQQASPALQIDDEGAVAECIDLIKAAAALQR
jgi:hypothetical protein